jgi:predicted nuclease with TOPRIM domain
MPKTQEWIKQKLEEERQGWTEYSNRRLTEEIEDLKQRVDDLETVIEELMDRWKITYGKMYWLALAVRSRVPTKIKRL